MLSKGLAYERVAQKYLQNQGLTSITNNYRTKFGEIDLVMRDQGTLVFVEVKYRATRAYGNAIETVTWSKQNKLIKTANFYLAQKKLWNTPCRFDVVSISKDARDLQDEIHWVKAAFDAS